MVCQAIFIYFFNLKAIFLVRPLIRDEVFPQMSMMLKTRFSYTAEGAHSEGKQTTVVCFPHVYGMWNILLNFSGTVFQLGFLSVI